MTYVTNGSRHIRLSLYSPFSYIFHQQALTCRIDMSNLSSSRYWILFFYINSTNNKIVVVQQFLFHICVMCYNDANYIFFILKNEKVFWKYWESIGYQTKLRFEKDFLFVKILSYRACVVKYVLTMKTMKTFAVWAIITATLSANELYSGYYTAVKSRCL